MTEIQKTIDGTNDKYSVSNLGNVRRNEHYTIVSPAKQHTDKVKMFYTERLLKKYINKEGYETVKLRKNNKIMTLKVHRLVADAFIDNPNNLPFVNHLNEIRHDNNVNNLEWCDAKQNANSGTRNYKLSKLSGIKVAQYTQTGELVKIWDSISQASKHFGCKTTVCIRRVCKGNSGRNTYKCFLWKYVDKKVIGDKELKTQIQNNKDKLLNLIINTFSVKEIEQILDKLKQTNK